MATRLRREIPPGIVAESWEISGHHSSPTKVNNGPLAGLSLPELLDRFGLDLVGSRSRDMLERGKFPLLIKLLDANKPLSVQVHPDDHYAKLHENGELGKTEMWYILHAEPGAYLIYGLKSGVTPDSFRRHLEAGTLETCLHQLPVKAGEVIFIPAGSVHAIMNGILLAEIQQNSDATYRVYDWNRVGADGQPRPLHVEKAMDVINFAQVEPDSVAAELIEAGPGWQREIITTSQYFNVERVTFDRGGAVYTGNCDGTTFEIWGTVSGHGQVLSAEQVLDLPTILFTLLPATMGKFKIRAVEPATLLRIYVPAITVKIEAR